LRSLTRIENHTRTVADTSFGEASREFFKRQHHEAVTARSVGKLPLKIQKGRARDVRFLIVFTAALHPIRPPRACLIAQIRCAIEDAQFRIGEMIGQPIRADDSIGMYISRRHG